MKKLYFVLLCIAAVSLSYGMTIASVVVTEYGTYEDKDILFNLNFSRGNSSPGADGTMSPFQDVQFSITSKKGFLIFNETYFIFEGRPYIFNARNIKDSFYEKGFRTFKGKDLKDGSVIELVYQVRKPGSTKYIFTKTVRKTFEIIRPKNFLQNGPDGIITLQEIK